jgi:hypothetical protein
MSLLECGDMSPLLKLATASPSGGGRGHPPPRGSGVTGARALQIPVATPLWGVAVFEANPSEDGAQRRGYSAAY